MKCIVCSEDIKIDHLEPGIKYLVLCSNNHKNRVEILPKPVVIETNIKTKPKPKRKVKPIKKPTPTVVPEVVEVKTSEVEVVQPKPSLCRRILNFFMEDNNNG